MSIRASAPADLWPRIRDTFVAPARLARGLGAAAPWLDVLLISTAIAMISILAMPDEVFTESMREAVTRRGQPVEITSPPEDVARWGRALGMLATLATHPVIAFVMAGLLTLVFTIAGGGRTTFREHLSLAAHGMLIPALGTLIAFSVRVATGAAWDEGPFARLAPAGETSSILLASLAALDPFVLWMVVVLGVGVAEMDARYPRGRAIAILVAGYLVLLFASTYLLNPDLR